MGNGPTRLSRATDGRGVLGREVKKGKRSRKEKGNHRESLMGVDTRQG